MKRELFSDELVRQKIERILQLCKEEGISISHEDSQGGFEIREWNERDEGWFREANNQTRGS